MATCPTCGRTVLDNAWFCAFCASALRSDEELSAETALFDDRLAESTPPTPSAQAPGRGEFAKEVTQTLAWGGGERSLSGEALIVGELSLEIPIEDPISVTFGAVAPSEDGLLRGLLLYADRSSAKHLSPSAIPRLTRPTDQALLTPYEEYLLTYINGRRTVRELQEAGLLAPEEMAASLLTLIDRGLVSLEPPRSSKDFVDRTEQVDLADFGLPPVDDLVLPPGLTDAAPTLPPSLPLEEPPLPRAPAPVAKAPPPRAPSPEPLPLEASALIELAPEPGPSPAPEPPRRIAPAPAKGTLTKKPKVAPPPALTPAPEKPDRPKVGTKQQAKAKDLYEAARRDQAAGNFVSARMNLKLAVAFDPENATYQALFKALIAAPEAPTPTSPRPAHGAAAKLYEEAERAEAKGEIDRTVRLLERALLASREAVILNRLGVILATRKHELLRAQRLLEEAIEQDSSNPAYVHNLSKVLTAAAVHVEGQREAPRAKPRSLLTSFWDRLRGRGR